MTVLLGDTGKIAHGTLRQTTINLPTPRESTSLGLTLPTTEPGSAQISYTVQASDFATFTGNQPGSVQNVPLVYACGKIGAAATVVSYRISVNGASQATAASASASANNYYTYTFGRYIALNVGDVVEVKLWSSQADTTLVYSAFTTCPTRLQLTKGNTIMKDLVYGTGNAFPNLASAPTPTAVVTTQAFIVLPSSSGSSSISVSNPSAITFSAMGQELSIPYYTGRCGYGDSTNTVFQQPHATNQSHYVKNYMPSTISFREVLR